MSKCFRIFHQFDKHFAVCNKMTSCIIGTILKHGTILKLKHVCFKLYKIFQAEFYIILNRKWFLIHVKLSNSKEIKNCVLYTLNTERLVLGNVQCLRTIPSITFTIVTTLHVLDQISLVFYFHLV